LERKRHRFSKVLSDAPVWVEGDSIRLVQVFENLFTNAAKYTDPGGELSVSMAVHAGEAVVRVRDNGLGISAAMRPRIFELFVQDERSVDRSQGGLGIGLALVRRLLEMHGGSIEAHSDGPGTGSEFVVRLQALPADAAPRKPLPRPVDAGPKGKVLIVEDDPDVGESMAVLLRLYGYEVERAVELESALRLARELAPQAVLMDLSLPGNDGYEVARRLRAMAPPNDGTTYIAISGFGQPEDLQRSKQAGFADHLVKPVDPDELDALLTRHLNRPPAHG
jgi:CheY-like chemotaxis protein